MSPSFSNPIECPLIPLFFILVLADGVEGTQRPARRLLPLLGGWAWVEALGPESCPPPGTRLCGLGGAWAGTGKTCLPVRAPGTNSLQAWPVRSVLLRAEWGLPHDGSGVRVSAACLEVPGRPGQRR